MAKLRSIPPLYWSRVSIRLILPYAAATRLSRDYSDMEHRASGTTHVKPRPQVQAGANLPRAAQRHAMLNPGRADQGVSKPGELLGGVGLGQSRVPELPSGSCGGVVLLRHAGRNAPTAADRNALLVGPGPDVAAAPPA